MRGRIAHLTDRVEQHREEAGLSPPVTYRDVARFFLWRGGYALAGPTLILLVQPFVSGIDGTILLGGGFLAMVFGGFAGCARSLDRPRHVVGFGALSLCALAAPVLRGETVDGGLSTPFAAGMAVLFGFASLVLALVVSDTVRRELTA